MNGKQLPKVTIMIPTYNQEAFIREAIESALAQTYPNLEVVVGDDASTDATRSIVESIADPRLVYVRNEQNLGRTENYRNLLYNHATGEYVVNLDGDDYYTDPDFISEAIKLIDGDPNVVIVAARARTTGMPSDWVFDIPEQKEATGLQIIRKLPDRKYFLMHMATLYAKSPALEIDFYRLPVISSDWESLYRLSLRGKVRYLNRIVGVWRIHEKNETQQKDGEKALQNLTIWSAIYRDAQIFGMSPIEAKLRCAKMTALSIESCSLELSKASNALCSSFLFRAALKYTPHIIIHLFTSMFSFRLVAALFGRYRRLQATT